MRKKLFVGQLLLFGVSITLTAEQNEQRHKGPQATARPPPHRRARAPLIRSTRSRKIPRIPPRHPEAEVRQKKTHPQPASPGAVGS